MLFSCPVAAAVVSLSRDTRTDEPFSLLRRSRPLFTIEPKDGHPRCLRRACLLVLRLPHSLPPLTVTKNPAYVGERVHLGLQSSAEHAQQFPLWESPPSTSYIHLERFSPCSHPFRALGLFTSYVSLIHPPCGRPCVFRTAEPHRNYSLVPFVQTCSHFALFAFEPCQFSFVRYPPTPPPFVLRFSTVEFDLNCSRRHPSTIADRVRPVPPIFLAPSVSVPHGHLPRLLLSPFPLLCISPRALCFDLLSSLVWGCASPRSGPPARICYLWN